MIVNCSLQFYLKFVFQRSPLEKMPQNTGFRQKNAPKHGVKTLKIQNQCIFIQNTQYFDINYQLSRILAKKSKFKTFFAKYKIFFNGGIRVLSTLLPAGIQLFFIFMQPLKILNKGIFDKII